MAKTLTLAPIQKLDYHELLDRVPGLVAVLRLADGQYSYVGKSSQKLLGIKPEKLLNGGVEYISSLIHPDDLPRINRQNQKALDNANLHKPKSPDKEKVVSFEYRIRHSSGKWIWLHTDGSVYSRTPEGKVDQIVNVSIDISSQKNAEQELKEVSTQLEKQVELRNERLALALEASQMGTWEWDVVSGELLWSDHLYRIFGLNPYGPPIDYETYLLLLHPDDVGKTRLTIADAMKHGKGYVVEHRCIWPDGSVHWLQGRGKALLQNGKPVRMIGTTVNIDERMRINAELAASQIKFQALFESNVIGIIIHNLKNEIIDANDTFLEMIGYTRSYVNKKKLNLNDITPSEYHKLDKQKLIQLKKTGEASPWEKQIIRKDSTLLPIYLGSVKIPSDHNFIAIVIDTTERQQLVAINNAKDEFISLASHQLRTPATGVKQYISLLMDGYAGKLTAPQQKLLETAYKSNERELHIIDDLLKVANIDAGKVQLNLQKTDLIKVVSTVVEELSNNFTAHNQKIILSCRHTAVPVMADQYLLRMVIENILDNAGKYSYDDQDVNVVIRKFPTRATIEIKDKGVGIRKSDTGRLFQKFSRIDNPLSREVGGSGLGLYWAKKIVDLHRGSITVSSNGDKGTSFKIKIPVE